MAILNTQILQTRGSGASANSLVDQQDRVMQQLADAIGASGQVQANGTLQVTLGGPGGSVLVSGAGYASLSASGSGASVTVTAAAQGPTVTPSITTGAVTVGGTSAGLMSAMGTVAGYQTQLDGVADALETTVNTQLEAGYTPSGTTGPANDLFTGSGAAGISVAISQPSGIAAALTTQPGDGTNAQTLATLGDVAGGPDQRYRSLIQTVGSDVQGINNQVATQTAVANAAQQNLQAVAGVNTDQQMVALLNFQQAYQASAKVISTAQAAIQSLLEAVG
jgi:flagellar hook-associated protein 1 FlgK